MYATHVPCGQVGCKCLSVLFSIDCSSLMLVCVTRRSCVAQVPRSDPGRPVFNIRRLHGCLWCELQGLAYYDCRTIHPSLWRCMLCGSASHSSCIKAWHYNGHRNHRIHRLKNQATNYTLPLCVLRTTGQSCLQRLVFYGNVFVLFQKLRNVVQK